MRARRGVSSNQLARRHLPPENALIAAVDRLDQEVEFAALADNIDKTSSPNWEIIPSQFSGLSRIIAFVLAAVAVVLVLSAGLRLMLLEKSMVEGLDTATVTLLCGAYISIASASDLLVKMETQAHGGVMPFSPSRMVFMAEFMKLAITTPVVLVRHACGHLHYPPLKECATAMRLMIVPAFAYSVNNAIILMVVSHMDFASLSVWRQLTPIFVALIWVFVFRGALGYRRWGALMLLLCGTMLNSYAQGSYASRWNPMLIAVLGSCCTTAVAGVANEYVLKQCSRLDIDFLCIFLYIQTTVFSFFLVIAGKGFSPAHAEAVDAEWTLLGGPSLFQDPVQLAIVGLQVLFGFAVARVIRHLGSVPRAIMNATKEFTVVIIAPAFVASKITGTVIISAIVVGSAAVMFSTAPAPAKGAERELHSAIPCLGPLKHAASALPDEAAMMKERLQAKA